MEEEVCMFGKFGFCKFKEVCKRKHFTNVCESLSRCTNIKTCQKIHPKACRRFKTGNQCKFKEDCAYDHTRKNHDEEKNNLKEKVDLLEKLVNEITNKVESKLIEHLEKVDLLEKTVNELNSGKQTS